MESDPALWQAYRRAPEGSPQQIHASLALLPVDASEAELLCHRMLTAAPSELKVIWEILEEYHQTPVKRIWAVLENSQADPDQRFRAACAVANAEAAETDPRWDAVSQIVTDRLLISVLLRTPATTRR